MTYFFNVMRILTGLLLLCTVNLIFAQNSKTTNMSKKIIYSEQAGKPIGPYSQAIRVGDLVFVSGQIGLKPQDGSIAGPGLADELKQVMANIGEILKVEGLSYDHIVKSTIFLTDMGFFPEVNQIYGTYFTEGNYPARETVAVLGLPKGVRVEISVIATAVK